MPAATQLDQIGVFTTLSPTRRQALLAHGQTRRLASREVLFRQGDAGDALFVVQQGQLMVATVTPDGDEKVLRLLEPGAVLGELALLDGEARSATVTALQPSAVWGLPRAAFLEALRAEPAAILELGTVLAQRVRTLTVELTDAALLDMPGRLCKTLLELAERGSRHPEGYAQVARTLTQQELAELIGSNRYDVNKQLNTFARLGWLRLEPQAIVLLEPERLAQRLG